MVGEEVLRAMFKARGLLCRDADRSETDAIDVPYHIVFGKFSFLPKTRRETRYYVLVSEYTDEIGMILPRSKLFVCERYADIAEIESFFLTIGVEGRDIFDVIE